MSLPVPTDTFTAANGTELHAYNAGWTQQYTDVGEIQSNAAILRGGGSEGGYKWDGDSFNNGTYNQYVQCKVSSANNYGGPTARMTGTSTATANGYVALFDGNKIDLQTITNGTRANLQAQMTGSVNAGDTVKLEITGTSIKVYVDSGSGFVQQGTTVVDSAFSVGQPGLYWLGAAAWAGDDWTADTIPTGGGVAFFPKPFKTPRQAVNRAGTY